MLVNFQIPISTLHTTKEITVYLPDDYYESNKCYPTLYIQDGQNAFFNQTSYSKISWGFIDYVKYAQLDIIMIAIPCNNEGFKRMDEYGPWEIEPTLAFNETHIEGKVIGGEGQIYVDWIKDFLKPYIDTRFRTITDVTGMVGSSMGGVITAYACLKYPQIFNKGAALSTAYWFYMDEFQELISTHDYSELSAFYFDLGEKEGCGDEDMDALYIQSNNEIYGLLKEKLPHLSYNFFEGATHNEEQWRQRVPLFMEFLYNDFLI